LREVVREFTRSQRRTADCGDTASAVECHILAELVRNEHITQQELADRLMLDKGWISRGIDGLVGQGLVTRTPHPVDRRRMQLRLTPAGQVRAAALDARLEAHASSLIGNLTPGQDEQLATLLAQVLANLRVNRCGAPCKVEKEEVAYRRAEAADWPEIEALLRGARLPSEWRVRPAYRYSVESTVYVDPAYVGQGVGRALYDVLLDELRQRGLHVVIGGIALPNEGSLGLHEKLGFHKVAHFAEVGMKFGRWIDVGYWKLNLGK
jgi:phosphinothricin acetyltransferase